MSSYRVHVADQRQRALTGQDGERYASPPHAEPEAFTLARLLLGIAELPDRHGPWQHAIPGGTRIVWLEQDSEP